MAKRSQGSRKTLYADGELSRKNSFFSHGEKRWILDHFAEVYQEKIRECRRKNEQCPRKTWTSHILEQFDKANPEPLAGETEEHFKKRRRRTKPALRDDVERLHQVSLEKWEERKRQMNKVSPRMRGRGSLSVTPVCSH